MFRILYRFLASMTRLAVRSAKDLEIIVLRHQVAVLGRRADQPQRCLIDEIGRRSWLGQG